VSCQSLGQVSYLNKHLRLHCKNENVKKWYERLLKYRNVGKTKPIFSEDMLNLVKFFVSTNAALTAVTNPFLRELLSSKIILPGPFSFRNQILPSITKELYQLINSKLDNALSVCLITDIWTNQVLADFIGLAAVFTNNCFEKEIIVIKMQRLNGDHTAEAIKIEMENMVNHYQFDKSKLNGKFSFNH
jgi:hypothetical protein